MKKQMTVHFILMLLVGFGTILHAQTPRFEWAHAVGGTIGDEGKAITVDADGNVYTTGTFKQDVTVWTQTGQSTLVGKGSYDVYIKKENKHGDILWIKGLGGNNAVVTSTSIDVDLNGDIFIAGYFSESIDFDPGSGQVIKSALGSDAFVLKLDDKGFFQWVHTISSTNTFGGAMINDLKIGPTGYVYLTGSFSNEVVFNPQNPAQKSLSQGGNDGFVQRINNSNGAHSWLRTFGGQNNVSGDAIAIHSTFDIYVVGTFSGGATFDAPSSSSLSATAGIDMFVMKLNWQNQFLDLEGINGSGNIIIGGTDVDANNKLYVTGSFTQSFNFNPNATANPALSGLDIFVLHLDHNLNYSYVKTMNFGPNDRAEAISVDHNNELYITGYINYTVTAFIKKLDQNGNLLWNYDILNAEGKDIAIGSCNEIHLIGSFSSPNVDVDPTGGIELLTHVGNSDAFNLKWSQCKTATYNPVFSYNLFCEEGAAYVSVDALDPPACTNPFSDWYLIEYFPGTTTEIVRASYTWGQQGSPYVYNTGNITLQYQLQPGSFYYVKHGLYDECNAWTEYRQYFSDIPSAPNPVFHCSNTAGGAPSSTISECEGIYLMETFESANGYNYDHYFIDLWSRPCGSNEAFSGIASLGWSSGQIPSALDIKTEFNNKGVIFQAGVEYQVKLAMGNDCVGWVDVVYSFCVTECINYKPNQSINNFDAAFTDFRIYPNPAEDILNIDGGDDALMSIRVMDALGRQILYKENLTHRSIDISSLNPAVYFIEIQTAEHRITKQFVKK
jgi:hypothetical protein